jgi:hypothetical protein
MSIRRTVTILAAAALCLLLPGAAVAATTYPDPPNDRTASGGPDIRSVTLSHTRTSITFNVRFATAPPLGVSTKQRWVDMLLIGIDVPPLGPKPRAPGGEWPGVDFALGTHGPSSSGLVVHLAGGSSRRVARFAVTARGAAISFSIRRRSLGDPAWFRFSVAAARETETTGADGGVDLAPDRGTFRYALTG